MSAVLWATLPIYLIVALGYGVVSRGWMRAADMRTLGRFVALIGLPALLFRAVAVQARATESSSGARFDANYMVVYALGAVMTATLVMGWARRRGKPMSLAAIQGMGASSSNSSFVGFPIALQLVGSTASHLAAQAFAMCVLVENLLVLPVCLALAGLGGATTLGARLRLIALNWLRNPMMWGIALGLLVALVDWTIPVVLERTIALLAGAAPPLSLFVIGGTLVGVTFDGVHADLVGVVVGKLLIHAMLVGALLTVWPLRNPALQSMAVLFAAMPMLSIYPVLAQAFGHERFCALALLAATVASAFTIPLVWTLIPAAWKLAVP